MEQRSPTAVRASADERPISRRDVRRRMERRILRAAAVVFAEAGFDGATTSAIAELADLPKANVHYYFGTKEALYKRVLSEILDLWISKMDVFKVDNDPAMALSDYIHRKIALSREYPVESRVFANEVIHGAQYLKRFLRTKLRRRVEEIETVFAAWADAGEIDRIDAKHLLFTLWAATQTYADFAAQTSAVLGSQEIPDVAADQLTRIVLRGCGVRD